MLTYGSKLLLVPALIALGLLGLLAFFVCRALIGLCVRPIEAEEDAPSV